MQDETVLPAASTPKIHINGQLHEELSIDLVELVIEESLSKPSRCLARFQNTVTDAEGNLSYKYFELDSFDFGSHFAVWLGVPPTTLYRLFVGRVNRIEGAFERHARPGVLVQSEDDLQKLRMKTRTRIFESMTDTEIIEQIASEYGLSTEANLIGPVRAHESQLNQTDFDFLTERVRAAGGVMRLQQNTLIVAEDDLLPGDPTELIYGKHVTDFSVNADLRNQCTTMGVAGWDVQTKEFVRQSASEGDLASIPASSSGGGSKLEQAFGQSAASIVRSSPMDADEAEHMARAYLREKTRQFITGTGVTTYSWLLRAGVKVNIQNIGSLFNGLYTVTALRHRFDRKSGLHTEFDVERSCIVATDEPIGFDQEKPDAEKHR